MQTHGKRLLSGTLFLIGVWALTGAAPAHALEASGTQALASTVSGDVYLLSVNEDGIIDSVSPADLPTGVRNGSYGIAPGDFDGDGLLDFLLGGSSSAYRQGFVEVWRGREDPGGFEPGETIIPCDWSPCSSVMDLAVADVDLDDSPDFAVVNFCSRKTHFLLGNGDGTFRCGPVLDLPFYAMGIDAGDLDGDADTDFLVVNWKSDSADRKLQLEAYLGDGAGGFGQETLRLDSPYANDHPCVGSKSIVLGDFDHDTLTDVVVNGERADYTGGKLLSFYRGRGDGTFDTAPQVSGEMHEGADPGTASLSAMSAADFDGDGCLDILGTHWDGREAVVYLGRCDGTFTLASRAPVAWLLTGVATLPPEDLNEAPVADPGGPYAHATDAVLLELEPSTLRANARGKWITAIIETDPLGAAAVTLDGTGSYDADGDEIVCTWTVAGETGGPWVLEGPGPSLELAPGHYEVTLVVNDGRAESEAALTTIDVALVEVSSLRESALFLNGVPALRSELAEPLIRVKFDREQVVQTLEAGDTVPVYLTGAVNGTDTVRVVDSPEHGKGGKGHGKCKAGKGKGPGEAKGGKKR